MWAGLGLDQRWGNRWKVQLVLLSVQQVSLGGPCLAGQGCDQYCESVSSGCCLSPINASGPGRHASPSMSKRQEMDSKRCLLWPFSFFHLPALPPLALGTLEGGLPKGPGASTYQPLKKAKAALGGRREASHSPGLLLRFLLLPAGGDSREQDGASTENRKQNQTRGHQYTSQS